MNGIEKIQLYVDVKNKLLKVLKCYFDSFTLGGCSGGKMVDCWTQS